MARILQIFNRYLERGGEEIIIEQFAEQLAPVCEVVDCWFESADWTGPGAPPKWKQALLMGRNPASLARLRKASQDCGAKAWLCHNQIPVASFGLYREALDLGVPVIQYCHNFRPFSVSGTLWANGKVCPQGLQGRSWPEVKAGAWQGSVLKSAILAWHFRRLKRSGDLEAVKHWITNSEFVRDRFVEAGLPAAKVTALRNFHVARPQAPAWRDAGKKHWPYGILILRRMTIPKWISLIRRR
jgi:hypothetical protein